MAPQEEGPFALLQPRTEAANDALPVIVRRNARDGCSAAARAAVASSAAAAAAPLPAVDLHLPSCTRTLVCRYCWAGWAPNAMALSSNTPTSWQSRATPACAPCSPQARHSRATSHSYSC